MADKKSVPSRALSLADQPHTGDDGKLCSGSFVFTNTKALVGFTIALPGERICEKCRRKETYEDGRVALLARKGTTWETLTELCKLLLMAVFPKNVEDIRKDGENFRKLRLIIEVGDGRLVAVLHVPQIEQEPDPDTKLARLQLPRGAKISYESVVEYAYRIPVVQDRLGRKIPR